MGSSGDSCTTTGFRYFAGLHLVFCHGLDALLGIRVGEKWAWTGSVSANNAISIDKPELFGGEGREGGVRGTVDACFGLPSQPRNSYLQSVLGADVPAFRGLFALVARKCMLSANSPYIKEWSILGRRTRIGWRDDLADILAADGHVDMNPAHIIRETLTNTTWGGMGYPAADLDESSFQTAAALLNAEGFGLSLLWAKNTSVEDFLKIILDHIDAKLYYSHITGLLKLKLVRNDYNIGGIPVLNESNILELVDYTGPAATETINQVVVNYVDRENNPCAVTVQDLAGITRMGGQINAATLSFVGIADGALASKVAARELQQLCQPISSCTLVINRKQSLLEPGDCFNFCWGPLGIENMAMRVDTVEIGLHTDSAIRIVAVRDVYGLGAITLTEPANSLWSNPLTEPADAVWRRLEELTWWQFVRQYGESAAVLDELDDASTMLTCFCGRPSSDALNYEMWTRNVGATDWAKRDTDSFPFVGTLAVAVPPATSSVLQLQEGALDTDMVQVGTYAAMGSELVAVTAIDPISMTVTVNRGVLDTIPVAHAVGEKMWFHQRFFGLDQTDRAAGEAVEVKILPSTSLGRLALEDAATAAVTCVGRMMRPYPPGNVQINGSRWPATIGAAAALIVTWSHRDRTLQTVTLNRQDEGNIGPEAGVTYTLRIYGETGTLLRTESGLAGTSYTYELATEMAESGLTGPVSVPNPISTDSNYPSSSVRMDFEGENGSTLFTDWMGNVWTAVGNAQLTTASPISGSSSLLLDGSGDYAMATVPNVIGTGDFTVRCKIKLASLAGDAEIFCISDAAFNLSSFNLVFEVKATGAVRGSIQAGDGGAANVDITTATGLITTGDVYDVAFVANGSTARIYIDGVQRASGTISGTRSNAQSNCRIGYLSSSYPRYLNGRVDGMQVFRICLYPGGTTFSPPTSPLVTWAYNRFAVRYTATTGTNDAQGITTDGTNIWFSNSSTLLKFTMAGSLVTSRVVTSDNPTSKSQINGLAIHDGVLYVSAAENSSPRKSWIVEYNPDTLAYIAHHQIIGDWFSEGLARKDGYWWVCFHATKVVAKIDPATWGVVAVYSLSFIVTGSSGGYGSGTGYDGIAWLGDYLMVNIHDVYDQDSTDVYWFSGSEFVEIARLARPTSSAHQGIALDPSGKDMWFAERNTSGTDSFCRCDIIGDTRAGSGLGRLNTALRIELEATRNSMVSLQKWNLSVTRG